jgi:integrase
MSDVHAGERRLFVAEGKGGISDRAGVERVLRVSGDYFDYERPDTGAEHVFVVLRGPTRGRALTAAGVDQVLDGARTRAGLDHATCHQLRHTCLTRLREAGMALEAVQAQAGHRSIESTRVYLHLANAWLAEEYARAVNAIEDELADRVEKGER